MEPQTSCAQRLRSSKAGARRVRDLSPTTHSVGRLLDDQPTRSRSPSDSMSRRASLSASRGIALAMEFTVERICWLSSRFARPCRLRHRSSASRRWPQWTSSSGARAGAGGRRSRRGVARRPGDLARAGCRYRSQARRPGASRPTPCGAPSWREGTDFCSVSALQDAPRRVPRGSRHLCRNSGRPPRATAAAA